MLTHGGSTNRDRKGADNLCAFMNHFDAQVRAQRFGNHHAAVGLLVVFEDREPGAADGESAAVERVDEIGFAAAGFRLMDARRAWYASKFEQEEISL